MAFGGYYYLLKRFDVRKLVVEAVDVDVELVQVYLAACWVIYQHR